MQIAARKFFTERLSRWTPEVQRDMPWTQTKDAYKIWVSEIILQQTRVNQGRKYYLNFIEAFPSVQSLANATEDEVLAVWQGLGYYSRARNLHKTAKIILKEYQGNVPDSYDQLLALPGIGEYTASAICTFAFNQPLAIVDGNVIRVMSRYFGIESSVQSSKTKTQIKDLASRCLNTNNPKGYNQKLLDFGATLCAPQSPKCSVCPIQAKCVAFDTGKVDSLPVMPKKKAKKKRHYNYLLYIENKQVWIVKRSDNDIWKGLYELILHESSEDIGDEELKSRLVDQNELKTNENLELKLIYTSSQQLSHQIIIGKIYYVQGISNIIKGRLASLEWIHTLPFPKMIHQFFQTDEFKALLRDYKKP